MIKIVINKLLSIVTKKDFKELVVTFFFNLLFYLLVFSCYIFFIFIPSVMLVTKKVTRIYYNSRGQEEGAQGRL